MIYSIFVLLIWIVAFVLLGMFIKWGMVQAEVPANIQKVAMLLLLLLFLLWLFQGWMITGPMPLWRRP